MITKMHNVVKQYFEDMVNHFKKNHTKRLINTVLFKFLQYLLVISVGFVIIFPVFSMISTAFTHPNDLGSPLNFWIPSHTSLMLFKVTNRILKPMKSIPNALLYSTSIMIIQVFTSSMYGYGLARFKFSGHKLIFGLVILTIIIPPQILILSQYLHFREYDVLGIITLIKGSPINLIRKTQTIYYINILGQGLKSGLYIYIFRQFYRGLPIELEEAANIDGAGHLRTYFQIMLPSAVSALLTVAVFSFAWNYGDTYFTGQFFNRDIDLVSVLMDTGITNNDLIKDAYSDISGTTIDTVSPFFITAVRSTALLVFVAPLLILYFIVQRKFVESFERSGITGM